MNNYYKIVYGNSVADLADKINSNIEAGFVPLGGISFNNQNIPHQAMIFKG